MAAVPEPACHVPLAGDSGMRVIPDRIVTVSLEEAYRGTRRVLPDASGGGTVEVAIPPGARPGQRIRVRGRAAPKSVTVLVDPHPRLVPLGADLFCEVEAAIWVGVLGGEVEVPTLEGPVRVVVSPQVAVGRVFRVCGLGLPRPGGGRGDLIVRIRFTLPTPLTPSMRRVFKEMRRLHEAQTSARGGRRKARGRAWR